MDGFDVEGGEVLLENESLGCWEDDAGFRPTKVSTWSDWSDYATVCLLFEKLCMDESGEGQQREYARRRPAIMSRIENDVTGSQFAQC